MNKKSLAAVIIAGALLTSPFVVSALSIEDIQAQIKELLNKVMLLQSGSQAQGVFSIGPASLGAVGAASTSRVCAVDFSGSLGYGSRGESVRALQEFLKTEGLLAAEATGYFGVQTQSALRQWQASQNIVSSGSARTTGWGVLGPRTRAMIMAHCGPSNVLTVSPTSGAAPLAVTVTSRVGDSGSYRPSIVDGQDTLIDFGDGSERQWVNCDGTQDNRYGTLCATPQTYSHTYTGDGSYTVTLLKAGGMCIGGCAEKILATAYVTVGGASNHFDASVSSGVAPLAVDFTFTPQTDSSGRYYIEYGDGQGELMSVQQIYCLARTATAEGIRAPCISPSVVSHTYLQAGDYTATVNQYIACLYTNPRCLMAQSAPLASMIIHVTGNSTNGAPSVSSFSGPTTLGVNQTGSWSVRASDPENGPLTYHIWWGDENIYAAGSPQAAATGQIASQQTTFTHTYASAGVYTVQITVTDSQGFQAQASGTVQVGSTSVCTAQYDPVCGRPQGCINTCAPGMYCTMMCRLHDPQTYGNRCALNAAGADYLYNGACTAGTF